MSLSALNRRRLVALAAVLLVLVTAAVLLKRADLSSLRYRVLGLPTTASQGETLRNVEYVPGGSKAQRLDLYLPEKNAGNPRPLVMYIHGNRWSGGTKEELSTNSGLGLDVYKETLLAQGYAVASIEYRLAGEATFPAQIHDVKAATRFLRARAGRYGLDPERFAVSGDSAGGHLAMLLGTTAGNPRLEGTLGNPDVSSAVQAVVSFYGISDIRDRATMRTAAGCPQTGSSTSSEGRMLGAEPTTPQGQALAVEASPITHVDAGDPPMLLLHGRQDCNATPTQSTLMQEALEAAGVAATVELIDAGHSEPAFYTTPGLQQALLRFLAASLGSAQAGG